MDNKTIGVLALQGAFIEHINHINHLGYTAKEVRLPEDLESIDALIIPGGESTTIGKLAKDYNLIDPIKNFAKEKPVWGTCAGLILIASDVGHDQPTLDLMDIKVERNAFGNQLDSFTSELEVSALENPDATFPGVFIRAPIITDVGQDVDVLSALPDGKIVAARQGNILATCFHPELTDDLRIHKYFFSL